VAAVGPATLAAHATPSTVMVNGSSLSAYESRLRRRTYDTVYVPPSCTSHHGLGRLEPVCEHVPACQLAEHVPPQLSGRELTPPHPVDSCDVLALVRSISVPGGSGGEGGDGGDDGIGGDGGGGGLSKQWPHSEHSSKAPSLEQCT
jgi:uncharacterized membrane protein YgcG